MKEGITRREREITDTTEICRILDTAKVIHIGMIDGDRPYIVPMNYGYTFEDGKLVFYLHGAKTGRKLDVLRANPRVCFEMECDVQSFDGNIACQYGMAYASIMGNGTAELIEDVEDKKTALSLLMKAQTGKEFSFEDKMTTMVAIVKIDVSEYTANDFIDMRVDKVTTEINVCESLFTTFNTDTKDFIGNQSIRIWHTTTFKQNRRRNLFQVIDLNEFISIE